MQKLTFDYYSMDPPEAGWVITARWEDRIAYQWYELAATYDAEEIQEIVGLLNQAVKTSAEWEEGYAATTNTPTG